MIRRLRWLAALIASLGTVIVFAQSGDVAVTDDMVNEIAYSLYCPVCPNERLDSCQTDACVSWRADIRRQLEAGRTRDEIVRDFVARYGERAVGTPLDPTLYALSVYVPFIIAGVALVIGLATFLRWRTRRAVPVSSPQTTDSAPDDPYRSRLEQDIQG